MLRRLVVAAVSTCALAAAPGAFACGTGGYSYAGLSAPARAFGISAVITPLTGFDVRSGHVAGWVGVGGPGLGPGGKDEWLQVGFSGFPGMTGSSLYYELALPNRRPVYREVATGLPAGRPARVAVLEISGRRDWWRVWVGGAPASQPIHLPGSHGRFSPIATAESWDGGTGGGCNGFLYRFHDVAVARAPGGSWQALVGGYPIRSSSTRIARTNAKGSFLAAEGDAALRTLASFSR